MLTIDSSTSCVSGCAVSECVHNEGEKCRASAIFVGNTFRPMCLNFYCNTEVFLKLPAMRDACTVVGACSTTLCVHNQDFECCAGAIELGKIGSDGCCLAFVAGSVTTFRNGTDARGKDCGFAPSAGEGDAGAKHVRPE
jgi:Domain of Unknown Function (DUF1540)